MSIQLSHDRHGGVTVLADYCPTCPTRWDSDNPAVLGTACPDCDGSGLILNANGRAVVHVVAQVFAQAFKDNTKEDRA